ncbi:hypothetical protein GCM10023189_32380 [Nibrella saemangeumensis]|uniref:HTH-like domain-containing protein n=1 Tax=Nibrella saemangeumensis TaxID=1084526 RepID=A0ABP8N495_9BACT
MYYKSKRINEDELIAGELKALANQHPNWGFRLMLGYLRLNGCIWNHKRVDRIYKARKLNLRVPVKRKRLNCPNLNTLAASAVNEVWSLDFLSHELVAEKKTRILNVMDEHSRKCLLVVAHASFLAKKLVQYLEQMVAA